MSRMAGYALFDRSAPDSASHYVILPLVTVTICFGSAANEAIAPA